MIQNRDSVPVSIPDNSEIDIQTETKMEGNKMTRTYKTARKSILAHSQHDAVWTAQFCSANDSTAALGMANGKPLYLDLSKAPHVLIAGCTGAGKSVLMHDIITSVLFKNSPDTGRLVLIDPKRGAEFGFYRDNPLLWRPVVKNSEQALSVLSDLCEEMERRYEYMDLNRLRNYNGYKIYVFIDELADLMYTSRKQTETAIVRLAQMGRAAGIHLIIATQQPVVKVCTGIIKANMPTRIALHVKTVTDSRVILDHKGAELLRGAGDGILSMADGTEIRFQAGYMTDDEIQAVSNDCGFVGSQKTAAKRSIWQRIFG